MFLKQGEPRSGGSWIWDRRAGERLLVCQEQVTILPLIIFATFNIVPPFSRLLYASFFSLSLPLTIISLLPSFPLSLLPPSSLSAVGESFGEKTDTYGCRETRTISVASPPEPFSLHYDCFPFASHNMCSC